MTVATRRGRLLTAREIAETTGVHVATVYRWWDLGWLPLTQLGGVKRTREDDLWRFIDQNTVDPHPPGRKRRIRP